MLRTSMHELTNQELLLRSVDKKFRPAVATFDDLPGNAHITTVAVKTATKLTAEQMDQLEAAIVAINGVEAAKVLVQGPDNGSPDNLPASHQADLRVEMGFNIRQRPE